ncbi:PH domain-containing protein [Halomonas sp. E19]|uniref:PH domain-containing protein n=1 Tax=Halomonas sp. E19 TaxID=3397247 RepID=UPI00403353F1
MSFHNAPLDLERLPRLEEAPLTPVSRRLAPCLALLRLMHWSVPVLLLLFVPLHSEEFARLQPWLAAGLAGLGLLMVGLAWWEARRRAYGLREHDLIYRRGLLVQRLQVLPLARLQHVETLSNPIERAFGLVRLACFTAGGRGADLLLEGLPTARAEAVKQHLLARLAGAADRGPDETADEA